MTCAAATAAVAGCRRPDRAPPAPAASVVVAPGGSAAPIATARGRDDIAVQLVATEEAFCARAESGAVFCWGYGANGELGVGSIDTRTTPVRVSGIARATRIAASRNRVCAVEDGRVLCWGSDFGENDRGHVAALVPKPIGDERDVVDVAVGFPHVCMIHANRRVTCRAIYPRLADAPSPRDAAGPASAIVATKDDAFSTETPSGVVTFRHGTIASGAAVLGFETRPGPLAKAAPSVENEEGRCELSKGAVSCGPRGGDAAPVSLAASAPARAPNALDAELHAKDARIVAARLADDGRLSICVALPRHRYPWILTNRQCFALEEARAAFVDEPAWTPAEAVAWWAEDGSGLAVRAGGAERVVPFPRLGVPYDEGVVEASRSGRTAVAQLRDQAGPTRTVVFYDLETAKQLWKRVQPAHLDEWLTATNDFVVHVFSDVMGNDGHYAIELTSRTGARVTATGDSAVQAADEGDMATHKGFSEASPRHVATWGASVTLHSIDAPRDATGFRPPPSTEIVLYDDKRKRLFAIGDAPLGSVTIFDRASKKVAFRGAPSR